MSEKGKVQLGAKDIVKEYLPKFMKKGRSYNKEEINKLIPTFNGPRINASPKTIDNALRDLVQDNKLKKEVLNGLRGFSLV